jgi:hypothetical protein
VFVTKDLSGMDSAPVYVRLTLLVIDIYIFMPIIITMLISISMRSQISKM